MYCRKCLNESQGPGPEKERERKVNMQVDLEEECYICPECGHIVNWNEEE